jgi:hypothetical protein
MEIILADVVLPEKTTFLAKAATTVMNEEKT